MSDKQDKLTRAFARMRSLKTALTNITQANVSEDYVREYREALEHLSDLGFDVEEFAVPQQMLKRMWESSSMSTTNGLWVERTFLMMKLEGVLGYFEFKLGDDIGKGEIGFRGKKAD